jgi:hypothetical protein
MVNLYVGFTCASSRGNQNDEWLINDFRGFTDYVYITRTKTKI